MSQAKKKKFTVILKNMKNSFTPIVHLCA